MSHKNSHLNKSRVQYKTETTCIYLHFFFSQIESFILLVDKNIKQTLDFVSESLKETHLRESVVKHFFLNYNMRSAILILPNQPTRTDL